ncbi:dual specificity protein phosphatase PPS1 [Trichodelitschia bisporula]|uniref:Dual specificity protein phosphatase PPS1 n=1 Tax=Trichodelitschia bisporula TaxID=703511 RepID=A0A6G1HL78_9PEZI|nr:dual specificity protein phosphatase PPS1 [Trichodelitschia bisporula]
MTTIVARPPPPPGCKDAPSPHLTLNSTACSAPMPVPNKHLPVCPPGPPPGQNVETPPQQSAGVETRSSVTRSRSVAAAAPFISPATTLLFPPDRFPQVSDDPPVYALSASELAQALEHVASQPLPDPKLVFPWLHGLHPENQLQLAFFAPRRRSLRKVPSALRSVCIIKADGDLTTAKLKGAIAPEELLISCEEQRNGTAEPSDSMFHEVDPREGFSVRNFQIQACKMGTVSDIVVYGDKSTSKEALIALAQRIAIAQQGWRTYLMSAGSEPQVLSTFIVDDDFSAFEEKHRQLVAVDSAGLLTDSVVDFFHQERKEMHAMSRASEIAHNVYLGPTPDPTLAPPDSDGPAFDVFIEATDLAHVPDAATLKMATRRLNEKSPVSPLQIEFPSSGSILPPTWSHAEVDGLIAMCQWISQTSRTRHIHRRKRSGDGDSIMLSTTLEPEEKKILIHCTDGYTESTLLGLAYFMYAEGIPVHEAWIRMHVEKGRNFFAYPSDVDLLTSVQPRILQESPHFRGHVLRSASTIKAPSWLSSMDGSLPSRILPYMYLGNLGHANNPDLLRALGIKRILSVGEPVNWLREMKSPRTGRGKGAEAVKWPTEDLLYIDRVQDNGVDPLTEVFEKCLSFIEKGKLDGKATLVHCRVGVSRSATICIAEVMSELGLSFPRAYCFVRARRLNVIIQPHLRFTYELLKWEEQQLEKRGLPIQRELEWATVSREIALMNKPYSRQ